MAAESGGEHRTPEPTFADVMNGFSFDTGRTARRRRWSRRRDDERPEEPVGPQSRDFASTPPTGSHAAEMVDRSVPDDPEPPNGQPEPPFVEPDPADPVESDLLSGLAGASASVRPYAWTRGRTRSGYDLQVETLVSTSSRGRDQLALLAFEHRSVAQLCGRVQSVAEVAARLAVPLGVAKVLVGDMAGMGLVVVHRSDGSNGDAPDLALMERVLSGLRRL